MWLQRGWPVVLDSLSAGDRAQLLELYARSIMLLELGRCADWGDLFAPGALVRCAGNGGKAPIEFKGRDQLLALARRLIQGEFDLALGPLAPPLRCRHLLSSISLFGAEDHA